MEQTSFSIIVPTYDRPAQLGRCLEASAALCYPSDAFEVVVVDDGGAQPLDGVIAPFQDRLRVRLLRTPNSGPGAARNTGAEIAQGRYLAFIDDDCRPDPGWLRAMECAAQRHPDRMLGGCTRNQLNENAYAIASQVIIDAVYGYFNAPDDQARFFASNNMVVPRAAFQALGGFDESFRPASEDRELCDRWRARGLSLAYVEDAIVHHAPRRTLRGFVRQHYDYGRGAARFHRVRAARGTGRMRQDARFHGSFLRRLGPYLRQLPNKRARVLGLLAVWQVANAAGFVIENLRLRLRS